MRAHLYVRTLCVQPSAASTKVDRQRCRESIITTFMNWKTQKSAVILKNLTNLVELMTLIFKNQALLAKIGKVYVRTLCVQPSAASTKVDRQRCRESILTTFMNWKTQKSAVILKNLTKLGGIDDLYLQEPSVVGEDWKSWPSVEYPDIYNYLIQTPSLYTGESLKAYKSFEAYNYYINGWIDDVKVVKITKLIEPHYMVTAAIRHSQKITIPPAKPWLAVKQNGTVVCAHCSCMAGLGEACSHIAALLFTLESTTTMNKNTRCTLLPCSWLPPTFQNVHYAELSDIDFSTPHAKRKKVDSSETSKSCYSGSSKVIDTPTEEELDTFLKDLSTAGKAVILSITPKFSDSFVPMCMRGLVQKPLTDLYNPKYLELSYPQLLDRCETVFENYFITVDMIASTEKHTRGQSHSKLWFQQRAGRVTASKLKTAVCTNKSQPSMSLIKSVCYPESNVLKGKQLHGGVNTKKLP